MDGAVLAVGRGNDARVSRGDLARVLDFDRTVGAERRRGDTDGGVDNAGIDDRDRTVGAIARRGQLRIVGAAAGIVVEPGRGEDADGARANLRRVRDGDAALVIGREGENTGV